MKKISVFIKQNRTFVAILVICMVLLILFVSIAVKSGSWPGLEASGQILSALAGAVVAAMITLFLLLGQTSSEEKKERNSKVFEEKLKIYQDFLETFNDILKDGEVTSEEALMLKFKISMITLHTSSSHINAISESIKNILQEVKNKPGSLQIDQVKLDELFKIVNQFRLEIYDDNKGLNGEELNKTLDNFKVIDELYAAESKTDEIVGSGDDDLVELTKKMGWNLSLNNEDNHPIILERKDIQIKIESDGKWYFSIFLNNPTYSNKFRREVYLQLRREFGGAFNTTASWGWYSYLNDTYKQLSPEEFVKGMTENAEFKQYIISRLRRFMEFMDPIPLFGSTLNQLNMKSNKWQSWPYYEEGACDCLANDYGTESSRPFIDFVVLPDKYEVVLSLRDGEARLGEFLKRIGLNDDRDDISKRLTKDFAQLDDAIAMFNDLIERIEQSDTDK